MTGIARRVLLAMLLGTVPAAAADPANGSPLTYARGRLSGHLVGVTRGEALATVSRATGAEIRGTVADDRTVTKRFDRAPLAQALDRLLGDQNFNLTYGPDGEPVRIHLLGVAGPRPVRHAERFRRALSAARAAAGRRPVPPPRRR
jgi:hypothetical protein